MLRTGRLEFVPYGEVFSMLIWNPAEIAIGGAYPSPGITTKTYVPLRIKSGTLWQRLHRAFGSCIAKKSLPRDLGKNNAAVRDSRL